MSIKDKLPAPPEGYEWVSDVSAYTRDTKIYLHLESAYIPGRPPRVPESSQATYEFCDPDEKSMIFAAGRILDRFEESAAKKDRISLRQVEQSKLYAALIIRPGEED